MNVYQKLNQARLAFHQLELKKTGHNKFAGYTYFELGDFLRHGLDVFNQVGLCANISFGKEVATMRIVNTDKPDECIEITSPMAEANLKGCHPIQNLGAVETYTRRYLWVTALEIIEHDALDATTGKDSPKVVKSLPVPEVELTEGESQQVNSVCLDIVEAWSRGAELEVLDLYYKTPLENEQVIALWKALGQHSKIRAFIKANKPESKA